PVPDAMSSANIRAFHYRLEMVDCDRPFSYIQTFASVESGPDDLPSSDFILDLDFTYTAPEPVSMEDALRLAGEMKARENEVFESLITNRCRELFGGD